MEADNLFFNTSNYVYYNNRIALTSCSDVLNRIVICIFDSVKGLSWFISTVLPYT